MKRGLLSIIFNTLLCLAIFAKKTEYVFSGKIIDAKTSEPIEFATIALSDNSLWAVSDEGGLFQIKGVASGKTTIIFSCLGYVKQTLSFDFSEDIAGQVIALKEDNLTLNDVVVTAKKTNNNIGTTYRIDRNTLNHMQVLNVTDVSQLLPGGKTSNNTSLLNSSRFSLRGGYAWAEMGSPTFGTGVEVDGVRLSNNATMGTQYGVDTRNINPANIESIEVVMGMPSVEYGDISSGIVKVHTNKGKTPWMVEFASNINNKQVSANKGLGLGYKKGIINIGINHTTSIGDIASPYTSYKRNNVTLNYSNTLRKQSGNPLSLKASVSGNIGGYNSKNDPDAFRDTYQKVKDNTIRSSITIDWLLNRKWISNLYLAANYTYSDKQYTRKENKSSSTSIASVHSMEEGYFVATHFEDNPNAPILIVPPGYWDEILYEDDRPINFNFKLRATWAKKTDKLSNNVKIGADYTMDYNIGRGYYYDDIRLAPSWREYRYNSIPKLHNLAWYAEEKINLYLDKGTFELTAGIRSDNTYINDSEYGLAMSFSPRFNAKYRTTYDATHPIHQLAFHAGWGKAVKLPSFEVLYPELGYIDLLTFVAPTTADNVFFSAYYTRPAKRVFNPDLRWQSTNSIEVGTEINTRLANISLSAYYNCARNSYVSERNYSPFTYKMTRQEGLNSISIPSNDRKYIVDRETGVVTVEDKRGIMPTETANYKEYTRARTDYYYGNQTPLHRAGVEWIVDFKKIEALKTSLRLDGRYYYYKGVDERVIQSSSSSALMMANGEYYKYIGFYNGGTYISNGKEAKQVQTNLTITTHIPKIRMIVSLRLEGSLYDYSQALSEYKGKQRSFVLDSPNDYFPSETHTDIYAGNQYVGLYPDYYISFDDMHTKIPFAEKFKWAKENDPELFNNLARLVEKSSYNYLFNPSSISAYFSANINITKEIGDVASVSFYAKNFINNMTLTKDSQRDYKQTLYNSGKIPPFYYGLTLRLKL